MKKIFVLSFVFLFLFPAFASAGTDAVFEAEVLEITQEREITRKNGGTARQQNVKLMGLEKDFKFKEFEVFGITDIDVVSGVEVDKGDKVLVSLSPDPEGNDKYVITDHVRRGYLYFLVFVFVALMILIGRWQGFKSFISLAVTFFIIMWFIIPQIVAGGNPLFISVIGSVIILALIIYVTWGWKVKSHIAMLSISISLFLTGLVSILFTNITKLSGLADDNILYLVGIEGVNINFEGLLLAGIIIGTVGVLDDVVISQISSIEQLKEANPNLTSKEYFKRGLKVGVDHLSSMTNTLFLAYAGASLPLLLLFTVRQEPFVTFSQVINNELIATEIVRALVGSVGLILAVPIATYFAAYYLKSKTSKTNETSETSRFVRK